MISQKKKKKKKKKIITTINNQKLKLIVPVDFFKNSSVVIEIFCALLTFTHFLFGAWGI